MGTQIVHTNISSLRDTLYGITTPITYVYATSSLMPWASYYYSSVTMVPPFTVDLPITTDAICPSLTGTAQLTINGGASPTSVQWYTSLGYLGLGTYVGTSNPMEGLAPK